MNRQELLTIAKPLLLNTEMVRATLNGYKTVTRRVVKDALKVLSSECRIKNPNISDYNFVSKLCTQPFYTGDILYVRETWQMVSDPEWECDNKPCCELIENWDSIDKIEKYNNGHKGKGYYFFKADDVKYFPGNSLNWRPSIHMPKEAARLFLRVTDVKVERLQDITSEQLRKEGLTSGAVHCGDMEIAIAEWRFLWDSTIKKTDLATYGWNANPWVWVIDFERIDTDA